MQRLGRYEILGELGRGAMGVVYRAQDPVIGRTVAIKTIRLSDITDPEEHRRLKERLFREARSAGMLSHPHIVTIYDIGQEGETAYIAMEFVNGNTLEHRLRHREDISPRGMLAVLEETASALDYAHQKGIIHRDVKPANIMFNDMGAAKIADFGVAKIVSHSITQADAVLGTPSYMAPEQIEARGVTGRSDQFALGVIAYQLLTGEKPFTGDTIPALMFKIVREDPPSCHHLNSTLGEPVDTVLRRALAKKGEDRFETCGEFASALSAVLKECPGWTPQKRGSVSSMPTHGGTSNTDESATVTVLKTSTKGGSTKALNARDIPAESPQEAPSAARTVYPAAPVEEEVVPPSEMTRTPLPAPRRRLELEQKKGIPAGKIAAALVAAAISVGAYFQFTARNQAAPEVPAQVQTTSQPAETPAAPPQPAQATPAQATPQASPAAPSQRPPAAAASVALNIQSTPAGATVTFNPPLDACQSPCSVNAAPGRYVATFNLTGYRPALKIFTVPQESNVVAVMEQTTGTLMVKSTPPGAQVSVDGKAYPPTPAMIRLTPGPHKLVLKKEGSPDHEEEITIKDQVISTVEVNWN